MGLRGRGAKFFMLAGDISTADRRVKVRGSGWGYQACRQGLDKQSCHLQGCQRQLLVESSCCGSARSTLPRASYSGQTLRPRDRRLSQEDGSEDKAVDLVKQGDLRRRLRGSHHRGLSAAESFSHHCHLGDVCYAPVSGDFGRPMAEGRSGRYHALRYHRQRWECLGNDQGDDHEVPTGHHAGRAPSLIAEASHATRPALGTERSEYGGGRADKPALRCLRPEAQDGGRHL